jgi:hypothetical protein
MKHSLDVRDQLSHIMIIFQYFHSLNLVLVYFLDLFQHLSGEYDLILHNYFHHLFLLLLNLLMVNLKIYLMGEYGQILHKLKHFQLMQFHLKLVYQLKHLKDVNGQLLNNYFAILHCHLIYHLTV